MPLLQILTFSFALWLGFYLLSHDLSKPGLRFAGLGLVAYAIGLGVDTYLSWSGAATTIRTAWLFVPFIYWFGAIMHLLPETSYQPPWLDRALLFTPLPIYLVGAVSGTAEFFMVTTLSFWGLGLWIIARGLQNWFGTGLPRRALLNILIAAIFLGLSLGLLIFPLNWLPVDLLLLAIGVDLGLVGYGIIVLDAYDEGQALLPDFLRSLAIAAVIVALLVGQMGLIVALAAGTFTAALLLSLLGTITIALALQTFFDPLQTLIDRLIFARLPEIQQARARLRAAASALPRLDPTLEVLRLDEDEFVRLTRRALSHMGNLERLAASPLTRLPIIDAQLNGQSDSTLARANALKLLLTASIERLKPLDKGDFGTADEWRHYNALYFPYVMGLKPYSRRDTAHALDPLTREAQAWFQQQVPERTLHNWQNAAAKLIAQELREMALETL